MKVFGKTMWITLIVVVFGGVIALYGKQQIDKMLGNSSSTSPAH
jgi:hypothetical protein